MRQTDLTLDPTFLKPMKCLEWAPDHVWYVNLSQCYFMFNIFISHYNGIPAICV